MAEKIERNFITALEIRLLDVKGDVLEKRKLKAKSGGVYLTRSGLLEVLRESMKWASDKLRRTAQREAEEADLARRQIDMLGD